MFSFGVSSALIDFKIDVKALISFVLASTSVCVAVDEVCKAFASSNNFSAFSIKDFCFSFERIRVTCPCKAIILSANWLVSTVAFLSTDGCSVFSTISVELAFSTVRFEFFSSTSLFLANGVVLIDFSSSVTTFSLFSFVDELTTSFVAGSLISLASTWKPKKKPAPTRTLAAPTFNFLIEYFSNFLPTFFWFINWLFLPNIFHLKIK